MCAAVAAGLAPFRQKGDTLRHDFVLAAFLTVFRLPTTLLKPAVDDHPVALAQVLSAMFRLLAEHDDVDEADLFLEFIRLLEPPARCQPEAGHRCPARSEEHTS